MLCSNTLFTSQWPAATTRLTQRKSNFFNTYRAALALAKLKVLDDSHPRADPYTRVLNPGRREKFVAEAAEGLAHMQRGFGSKHMLVVVMRKIQEDCVHA